MTLTEALASNVLEFDDVPFRGIVEQSLAGVYVVLDERFMYANDTFAAMFGYSRDEFIGRRMVDCVTQDSIGQVMENYRRRISGEVEAIHYFTKGVRKDGEVVHLELHASRVKCRGRPALAGVALDVTERVLAQEELRRSREQLRELTRHINKTREAERARLAREVHDVLGGMLTAVKFGLARIVRRTRSRAQPELHDIAGELLVLMQDTIDTARSISEEMRPATLEHFGLGSALSHALERFGARYGLQVQCVGAEASQSLPPAVALQIFRIVQEGLTNVARHAGASRVELEMSQADGRFALCLRDDGLGLHALPRRAGAIGLFSMAERAREIGAGFDVAQRPEGGTQLRLNLPLPTALPTATSGKEMP